MTGKMPSAELLAEVEWLLEGGVHPVWIAAAVGRQANAIEKACQRAGRLDLARPFTAERKRTRNEVSA